MALRSKRFRRRQHRGNGKLHPAAILGICVAAAVVVTVVVGNLLKLWLDDDTFHRLTVGDETEAPAAERVPSSVRDVNAYPFSLGDEMEDILGKTAVSVAINAPDGTVQYTSELTAYLGYGDAASVDFRETMRELVGFIPYVSGVFHAQAFSQNEEVSRFAATGEDAALMREFVRAGGGEILIRGIPLTATDLPAAISYLESVRFAVGEVPVGVAVPLSAASDEDGWRVLGELLKVCDFCALDVSGETVDENDADENGISPSANAVIASADYYVSSYGMRLLISERQTLLLRTLERNIYPNFQVIRFFEPTPTAPEDDAEIPN